MKKLPTWAKVIIVIICFPIAFKFGNAFMDWILNLLTGK
jgi:hypothetical protein